MMMMVMMMIERIGLVTIMMIMAVYVDARSDSTQATTRDDWQTHTSQREGGLMGGSRDGWGGRGLGGG